MAIVDCHNSGGIYSSSHVCRSIKVKIKIDVNMEHAGTNYGPCFYCIGRLYSCYVGHTLPTQFC